MNASDTRPDDDADHDLEHEDRHDGDDRPERSPYGRRSRTRMSCPWRAEYAPRAQDVANRERASGARSARRARPRGPRAAGGRAGSGARRRPSGRWSGTRARRRTGSPAAGERGSRRGHGTHGGPAAAARGMARWLNVHRVQLSTRSSRAAASSAGRIAAGSRRRTRQRAPANAWLATVAKPCLVLAQRQQQVRDPVRGGQRRVRHPHAPAVHAPPAHEQRARLPHEPDAERAALEHEPRARVQLARLVPDQVAEQARARSPRRPRRARARGLTTFAPRFA